MKIRLKLLLLSAGLMSLSLVALSGSEDAAVRERTFRFTYQTTIAVPEQTGRLEVWLPYPKADENQDISDVRIDSPGPATVHTEPAYHNKILYVSVDDPGETEQIRLEYTVRRREYLRRRFEEADSNGVLDPRIDRFLKPNKLVPINARIREWAGDVTQGKRSALEKARAIYDYAISILKYDKSGRGWGRGDLLYACDEKRGNCTDFHAVFTGFSRAVGIPARFEIGFPLPEARGEGEIPGYHCWAQFHLKGYGWVPVDASEAWKHPEKRQYFFGGLDENRVQLSVGRDIDLEPKQGGDALNYFIYPYAEADGNPISDGVDSRFYFKDIP